jgi:hypothetical protein
MREGCPGCAAQFTAIDGPTHPYMESSPACWHAFGQVMVREYGNDKAFATHRLSVDAYAVQHPGGDSRQAIQSVGLHLVRLCMFLERGLTPEAANDAMLRAGKTKSKMFKLARPANLGEVTVADVLAAQGDEAHAAAVRRWARSVWEAWAEHHATVRAWADSV